MNTEQKAPPNFSALNKRDMVTMAHVLTPLFFIVFVSIYFHEFVWKAVEANLGINIGIICAASLGVFLIVLRLVQAQDDFRIIERFGYEAAQGVYMKTLLAQPWLKNRYVRHYLSHIANTGGTLSTQLEQSAIESELHALEADYNSRLEFPQFLVGFMIAMGLLGTFIGLLETLTGISGMLDGMGATGGDVQAQFLKLVVELRKPLAGMGIAFSASMFGLVTSLMLAIMMTNLRRYVSRVMSLARNVMHDLTEMTREESGNSFSGSLSPSDIDALMSSGGAAGGVLSGGGLKATNEGDGSNLALFAGVGAAAAGNFDVLTKKIELLIEASGVNTEIARKLFELIGFGPRIKEISEKTLEEMKVISANGREQQSLMQSLIAASTDTARSLSSIVEMHKQTHLEQQGVVQSLIEVNTDIVRTVVSLLENQKQVRGERQRDSQSLIDANTATARAVMSMLEGQKLTHAEQQRESRALIEASIESTRITAGLWESQKLARTEFSGLITKLSEQLADSKDVDLGAARHLYDIKESFTKLCNATSMIDHIASGVGGQTALLEVLIEETKRTQNMLGSINRSIQDASGSRGT